MIAVVGTTLSGAASAADEDPLHSVSLEFAAPPNCSSDREVLAKLREALGKDSAPLPEVAATITITAEASRVLLHYRASRGEVESRRTLALDTCNAATEASVLLLLLTLDPALAETLGASRVVEQAETSSAEPEPVPEPAPESTTVPPTRPPEAHSRARVREAFTPTSPPVIEAEELWVDGGWLALGGSYLSAAAPTGAFGVALEGGVRRGALHLGATMGWVRSTMASVDDAPEVRVRGTVQRAHLLAALAFGSHGFRFGPEAQFGVERLELRPFGLVGGRTGTTALVSAAGGGWASLAISESWGALVRASAWAPLERPRFWLTGLTRPVHQPGAIGADVCLGVFWAWGSQL